VLNVKIKIDKPGDVLVFDKRKLSQQLRKAGNLVAADARALTAGAGSGRQYGQHRASAPGQPPAKQTGELTGSIKVNVKRGSVRVSDAATAHRGAAAFYARFLELGAQGGAGSGRRGVAGLRNTGRHRTGQRRTQGKRVLAPRPFLSTAVQRNERAITALIGEAVVDGLDFKK
jgi:hypothetical protein